MGQVIIKRKRELKCKLKHKASKVYLNHKIKKFNKKYNMKYYEHSQKKETKEYQYRPDIVKITYIGTEKNINLKKNLKYSYIYKGVPGGWYYDSNG